MNARDEIAVTDSLNHRVQIVNSDGKYLRSFGREGNKAGEFQYPTGIYFHRNSSAEVEGTECEEYVTLATLKQMLSIQESTLKSIFESFIVSVNHRVDDLVKTVAEVKSSLEYTQRDVDDLGQMAAKLKDAEEEIGTLQTELRTQDSKLEYLENQSRRNNIRVSGIPESPNRPNGNIFVVGQSNHRIQIFSGEGDYVGMFDVKGSLDSQLSFPPLGFICRQ